jgi:cell division protein FtsQ
MATQNRRGAKRTEEQTADNSSSIFSNLPTLVLIAVMALVIYGSGLLYKQIDKPLTNVMIGGNFTFLETAELSELVVKEIDGGFLSINLSHLSDVLRQHPWVDQVNVRREWPSILKVEVVEEVPIARWGEKGFLNRLGEELLIKNNSHLGALPVLRADFGSSRDMMENYQLMAELLIPTGLKIAELKRDNLGVWFIDTATGLRLVIGRDQVSEKIRRFTTVWAAGLSQQLKHIKTIDLRYPNGLAVAWKDGALVGMQNNSRYKSRYNSRQKIAAAVQA